MDITKLMERFRSKYEVDEETGCWLWTASTAGKGYGQIKKPGERKQIYAHRLSYIIHKGDIPDDVIVCHTCDNPRCVNPDHLFVGSQKDNLQDMKGKDRHLRGERNARSKLNEDQVNNIHQLHETGRSTHSIAKQFEVCQMTIWRIVNGERWGHVHQQRHGE